MTAQGPDRSDGDRDVLSNLPRSRPHRRSSKREGVTATKRKAAEAAEASSPATGTAKPADTERAARKPAAKAKAPTTTTAAAARRPKPVAAPAAGAAAGSEPRAQRLRKPPPPPSPLPPTAGKTEPPKRQAQPSGTELVGTVVQAASELAQVGLTIGGQVLKRAVSRLPKP